ncbi:MAG: hypothetical protein ABIP75_10465, partial [Pyrinomonadaceae bacterium]
MFYESARFPLLLGVLLTLLASAGTASAQLKCQVTCPDGTSLPVSCSSKIDPCPLRDLATPPAFGSPEWQAVFGRYDDVLSRLRRYVPTLLKDQKAPAKYDILRLRSSELYLDAAFQLDTLLLRNRWLGAQNLELERELQALRSRAAELRKHKLSLPTEKAVANAQLALARREASSKRAPILNIQAAADAMRLRADRAAQDCIYWLAVATPPELRPLGESALSGRIRAVQDRLSWTEEPPAALVQISRSVPAAQFNEVPSRRPSPPGSAYDRIAAAEALLPQFADALDLLQRNEVGFAQRFRSIDPARARVSALMNAVANSQGELNRLRAQIASQTTTKADLQTNGSRAVANLRRAAAEAFVLEAYRDRTLIPDVRRFLSANRVNRTLDHAALVRIYTTKASLLPQPHRGNYLELN